jgi:acetoin utilization deacetylase AcuC-like enzyme
MTTSLFTHPLYLEHDMGAMHPESPLRLGRILEVLRRAPIDGARLAEPRKATVEELSSVHRPEYVAQLTELAGSMVQLDPDTAMSERSYDAAVLAAGAGLSAVEAVMSGQATNAFALVRPPGHHAEASRAMGFCLFNNVAVAAEAALKRGAERVLVLDWDVHHGNGTQHSFYGRRDVLYMSSHQFPFYPGTGAPEEIGEGAGQGFTVNCALPAGQTDADFGAVFHDLFLPIASEFKPDLVLVSAGFDPHRADPLAGMRATERGFAAMCSALKALAEEQCQGRIALLLEGGYDVDALSQSVHACVEVLAGGRTDSFPDGVGPTSSAAIQQTRSALRGLWSSLK